MQRVSQTENLMRDEYNKIQYSLLLKTMYTGELNAWNDLTYEFQLPYKKTLCI